MTIRLPKRPVFPGREVFLDANHELLGWLNKNFFAKAHPYKVIERRVTIRDEDLWDGSAGRGEYVKIPAHAHEQHCDLAATWRYTWQAFEVTLDQYHDEVFDDPDFTPSDQGPKEPEPRPVLTLTSARRQGKTAFTGRMLDVISYDEVAKIDPKIVAELGDDLKNAAVSAAPAIHKFGKDVNDIFGKWSKFAETTMTSTVAQPEQGAITFGQISKMLKDMKL